MAVQKRKQDFFTTTEGMELKEKLEAMEISERYSTEPSYSPVTEVYGDNLIPFAEKHMKYLLSHPSLDPLHYISNLELMTRVR